MKVVRILLTLLLLTQPVLANAQPLSKKDVYTHTGGLNSHDTDTTLNSTESPAMSECRITDGAITKRGGWTSVDNELERTGVSEVFPNHSTKDFYWCKEYDGDYITTSLDRILQNGVLPATANMDYMEIEFINQSDIDCSLTMYSALSTQGGNVTSPEVLYTIGAGETKWLTFDFTNVSSSTDSTYQIIIYMKPPTYNTEPILGIMQGKESYWYSSIYWDVMGSRNLNGWRRYIDLNPYSISHRIYNTSDTLVWDMDGTSDTVVQLPYLTNPGDTFWIPQDAHAGTFSQWAKIHQLSQTFTLTEEKQCQGFKANTKVSGVHYGQYVKYKTTGSIVDSTGTTVGSKELEINLYSPDFNELYYEFDSAITLSASEEYTLTMTWARGYIFATSWVACTEPNDNCWPLETFKLEQSETTNGEAEWSTTTEGDVTTTGSLSYDLFFQLVYESGTITTLPTFDNGFIFNHYDTVNSDEYVYLFLDNALYSFEALPPQYELVFDVVISNSELTGTVFNTEYDADNTYIVNGVDDNTILYHPKDLLYDLYVPIPVLQSKSSFEPTLYPLKTYMAVSFVTTGESQVLDCGALVSSSMGFCEDPEYDRQAAVAIYLLLDSDGNPREDAVINIYQTEVLCCVSPCTDAELDPALIYYLVDTVPNESNVDDAFGNPVLVREIPQYISSSGRMLDNYRLTDVLEEVNPATVVAKFNNRLFLAGCEGYPNRVYYSDLNEYSRFYALSYFIAPDKVTAFGKLLNTLVVFTKDTITNLYAVSNDYISKSEAYGGIGTPSVNSVQSVMSGSFLLFLSYDGIYRYDGKTVEKISQKVESIINRINWGSAGTVTSLNYDLRNEYWISLPLDGATTNTHTLIYNYENNFFTEIDEGFYSLMTYINHYSGIGVMHSLKSDQLQRREYSVYNTQLFADGGETIDLSYTTNWEDFNSKGTKKYVSYVKLVTQSDTNTTLGYSVGYDYDDSFASTDVLTITAADTQIHKIEIDNECDAIRLKFEHTENKKTIKILGWTYYYREDSTR